MSSGNGLQGEINSVILRLVLNEEIISHDSFKNISP